MSEELIEKRFSKLAPFLDERQRRIVAAVEAELCGHGGVSTVARACNLSRNTIAAGRKELAAVEKIAVPGRPAVRVRRAGGGRKRTAHQDATLVRDLEALVEPITRGDPESPLRWTCKSTRNLAKELKRLGHQASHRLVAELLHQLKYSLQANRKTKEGASHPDRNAQFEFIYRRVQEFQAVAQPVISVDAKKKEKVGQFKNGGREWRPPGQPEEVLVYDFESLGDGKVCPYGVYDLSKNEGWVSVGIDHDTAAFAVASIRNWWNSMGRTSYPTAHSLLITADGGGSNGVRVRRWKTELQKFADETGLSLYVCHFPPGTSKWNKIEHRLFSFISQNWRGQPLVSHEVIVNLIAATTTEKGLRVKCAMDYHPYPKGVKVTPRELREVKLNRESFHGEWNYSIQPKGG